MPFTTSTRHALESQGNVSKIQESLTQGSCQDINDNQTWSSFHQCLFISCCVEMTRITNWIQKSIHPGRAMHCRGWAGYTQGPGWPRNGGWVRASWLTRHRRCSFLSSWCMVLWYRKTKMHKHKRLMSRAIRVRASWLTRHRRCSFLSFVYFLVHGIVI